MVPDMTTDETNMALEEAYTILPKDLPNRDPFDIMKCLEEVCASGHHDPARPERILPADLLHLEALFQARGAGGIDDRHVDKLLYTLSEGGDLTPISVWRCGSSTILLDGHHRTKAYKVSGRRAGKTVTIPVTWIEGTPKEALAHATSSHRDIRLPLTHTQRSDHAWMLVCLGIYSKADEVKMTGLPRSTIGNMRKARKALMKAGEDFPSRWASALSLVNGWVPREDMDWEDIREQKAKEYADRIEKAVGPQFFKSTEIIAATIEKLCPGRIPELIKLLDGNDPYPYDEDEEADF
jgi:hypothetical protein